VRVDTLAEVARAVEVYGSAASRSRKPDRTPHGRDSRHYHQSTLTGAYPEAAAEAVMNGSIGRVGPQSRGEAVRQLHAGLLRLGVTIAAEELAGSRPGPTTRAAVAEFQRASGLSPTGTVDAATALALQAALTERPEASGRWVVGRVRWAGGTPAAGMTVRAVDRDLRREQPLGEPATTDKSGSYRIAYSVEQFARAEKDSADLLVRVYDSPEPGARVRHNPPLGEVLFNAPELAVIDVDLAGGPDQPTEYERIFAAVGQLLDDLPLDGLRQDREFQDVTFLAGETGFPPVALAHFGVAQKLAVAHQLPAAFFYALFATEVLLTVGPAGMVGARFGIDLGTDLQPLFYDIVQLPEPAVRTAVRQAIDGALVPASLAGRLDGILAGLARARAEAERYRSEQRPKALFAQLERFLAAGTHEKVLGILASDALGDLPGLLTRLADASAFPDRAAGDAAATAVLTIASLADVLGYDEQIIERIRVHQRIERPADVRRLARLNPGQWRTVLRETTAEVRVAGAPVRAELVGLHASALARKLEARYPTTAFAAQLERDQDRGGHREVLLRVLAAEEDFDLTTGNLELLLRRRAIELAPAAKEALKRTQRVFKLAPTYRQTQALLAAGVPSAAKVHAMGETRFVSAATGTGEFTDEQARTAYRKAADVHLASVLLAGELQAAAGAMSIPALAAPPPPPGALAPSAAPPPPPGTLAPLAAPPLPPGAPAPQPAAEPLASLDLQPVLADFPNLQTLFQLADACVCEECRSVHSAAAYLVDTLQFLADRLVTDAGAPGPALKVARDVLFERRPDLGDLDLSCGNTNTPVPYIDLVCELLEEAVAPEAGVPFPGPVTAGVDPVEAPTAALLALLVAQGWPFTGQALVYEPDLSGARVVRDTGIVAKLIPDGGGGWLVKRLKQTVGTAAELAAAPQYLNPAAYAALAASKYAFALPFDLAHQETRSYFGQFGIGRWELMRALQVPAGPADAVVAAEELGLSEAQRQLVVTADPASQGQIWNTAPLAALGGISRVDNLLARARLDYVQLGELLGLAWLNPGDAMFVKHLDTSCDLSQKTIEQLDNPALDRLHRFLRLLRAGGMAEAGWTAPLLDRAVRADKLGGQSIGDTLLVTLTRLHRVRDRLGLPLPQVLDLYDLLTADRYAELFVNESANGPVDDAFRPANVTASQLAEEANPGTGEPLAAHTGYLATCLGVSAADAGLLVAALGPGAVVSFGNLAAVHAATLLLRGLGLTAAELRDLRELTGLDPLASPADTVDFADRLEAVAGAGTRPADLRYLLRHEADDLAARDLSEDQLTTILTSLQAGYQAAYGETRPDLDPAALPAENTPGLRALLSTVPGVASADLSAIESIVDGSWADPALTPEQFIDGLFGQLVDTAPIKATIVPAPTEAQQTAIILAIASALSGYFYVRAKRDLLEQTVAATFALPSGAAAAVLGTARLPQAPALPLWEVLTDDAMVDLAGDPPAPPPVAPAGFDLQYRALRLLHVLGQLLSQLRVGDDQVGWLLTSAGPLGWLAPDTLPYQTGLPAATLESWQRLAAGVELTRTYRPVANPLDPTAPWTVPGLFDLVLAPGSTAPQVHAYLAQLAGWDQAAVSDLDAHFGLSAVDLAGYRLPETVARLAAAAALLRRLGLPLAAALPLVAPVTTATEAATMRLALKARYAEPEWPGVLQRVQDRLRAAKRDALVAYLLAENPAMRGTGDLYDHFLIDVEMSPCMPTSRIVQAHATVQLFVARCLMGLEPQSVAATTEDPAWEQWKWMANFRVWEANRKIFLYPENWIEPELRDDRSELFVELDNQLQQDELTDLAVEKATIAYLEKLDELAHLDVMACYFQHDIHAMHVFARTKGGDPAVYYHRQFEQERAWTPWLRVPLDITGEHLLAFDRNRRLTLAWPVFTEETDTNQTSTIPDPDSIPAGGQETEPPSKRYRIQLAVGERAYDTWQPKKVSAGGLLWPASGYSDSLPGPEEFHFFGYSVGTAGQAISCLAGDQFVGSFALTGCRGYPEPTQGGGFGGLQLSPTFKETELLAERFAELVPRQSNDLAISTAFGAYYQTIVAQTPGRFKVTYPMQLSLLDLLMVLLQLLLFGQHSSLAERQLKLPLGSFMPYFYGDFDRAYVIVPGFYDRKAEDPRQRTEKTYSDIDQFVRDVLALLFKYLQAYLADPQHDLAAAVAAMVQDPEYARLSEELKVYLSLSYGVKFENFYHPLVCFLKTTLHTGGVPALMSRATQLKDTGFDFETVYQPAPVTVEPYPVEDVDFRPNGAYAGYNWELFFHLPFDIAMRLNRDQRFEQARDWFHYVFDPVGSGPGAAPQRYWVTKPFFQQTAADYLGQRIEDIMLAIASDPSGASITSLRFAVAQWRDKPFRPHVVARTRPVAYQLAIVVNYIKNLVDWGDQLFRQFTRESVTQATQLYLLADKLLGAKPSVVPPPVTPAVATFHQLEAKLDRFGNALLDLENLIPDLDLLPHGGAELPSPLSYSALYFCIPPNEKLLALWDLIADRLLKIRSCQNIDGVATPLALFAPPIDPGALVRAVAGGLSISSFLAGLGAPLPNYRFRVMSAKATELATRVSELGHALLAVLERRDAEQLARLRAAQEISLLTAVREVKLATIAEAEGVIEALRLSQAVAQERKNYYSSRELMTGGEKVATALASLSLIGEAAIAVGYILSGGLKLIPDFLTGGAGFGGSPTVTLTIGGTKAGESAESAVMTLSSINRALDKGAGIAATQAGYHRRKDDWEHQAAVAGREVTQIEQQIANAQLHVDMLKDDLAAHDREAGNARQTDEYLHDKYTNQELYEWMLGQASSVYFGAYQLAFEVAKKAERCFGHELGTDTTFLQPGYWDSLRKGLTAADRLHHDLKRMEVAYLDQHTRERELTKHISLAQLNPAALIELRATGSCVVDVPEAVFDLDHPGHYFRRLRAVSLSIPCVAGPYTPVAAKLSLVSNRYRRNTAQRQGVATAKERYQEEPGDSRFAYNIGAIESIATSGGLSDSGMFELDFSDERYLPFEGKGAIGSWRLELPQEFRQFDYDTISDVILHLRYTARDGGSTLRTLVEETLRELLNEVIVDATHSGLWVAVSLRHQFPDQWWQLQQQQSTDLAIGLDQLPFLVRGHAPAIDAMTWYARVDGDPGSYQVAVAGDPAVTLNRVAELRLCVGPSPPVPLGTPFTIAADPTGLADLTLLVHYQLTS
jgi:hypothetical protein